MTGILHVECKSNICNGFLSFRVDDVVLAFKKLLDDEAGTGGVLYVTPKGIGYKYKPSKL